MKKIALIGGIGGQDGSFLAELLLSKDYEVHGLIRRTSQPLDSHIRHLLPHITLHPADMTDAGSIHNAIEKSHPDEIYSLAGMSQVRWSYDVPSMTMDVNCGGLLRIIESVRSLKLDCKIYYAASSEMYGKVQQTPQTETTPFYPRSPYGCFPKGTRVVCWVERNGRYGKINYLSSKKIENIKVGDVVLSYNTTNGKKEEDVVVNTMIRDSSELLEFEFSNGNRIECTDEHPFYVVNGSGGEWKVANELKVGDKFIQYKYAGLQFRIKGFNREGPRYIIKNGEKIFKKGKSYNELYGEEKSVSIKNKLTGLTPWNKGIKSLSPSPMKGKKHPYEIRVIMSQIKKEQYQLGLTTWNKGFTKHTHESLMSTSKKLSEIACSKRPELRKKIQSALKLLWEDKDYRDKMIAAQNRKINKHEAAFLALLEEWFPDKFRYVGDGSLWIGRPPKNPDFIHKEFDKVIEYNGSHWHTKQESDGREIEFKKNKFDCLTVWDYELKNKEQLFNKVQNFVFNPNSEVVTLTKIGKKKINCSVYNVETKSNNNYFANGILVHNCSKAAAYYMARIYRESYGMKIYCGILFNHESERRGEEFLSRKLCKYVASVVNGNKEKLKLGNLDAQRDFGYAKEYVEWIWHIMQHPIAEDFVIATGETHSIREFVEKAFGYVGINSWQDYIVFDKALTRPAEVDLLIGNAEKSKRLLGFTPKVMFNELVEIMMQYELDQYTKPNYSFGHIK